MDGTQSHAGPVKRERTTEMPANHKMPKLAHTLASSDARDSPGDARESPGDARESPGDACDSSGDEASWDEFRAEEDAFWETGVLDGESFLADEPSSKTRSTKELCEDVLEMERLRASVSLPPLGKWNPKTEMVEAFHTGEAAIRKVLPHILARQGFRVFPEREALAIPNRTLGETPGVFVEAQSPSAPAAESSSRARTRSQLVQFAAQCIRESCWKYPKHSQKEAAAAAADTDAVMTTAKEGVVNEFVAPWSEVQAYAKLHFPDLAADLLLLIKNACLRTFYGDTGRPGPRGTNSLKRGDFAEFLTDPRNGPELEELHGIVLAYTGRESRVGTRYLCADRKQRVGFLVRIPAKERASERASER